MRAFDITNRMFDRAGRSKGVSIGKQSPMSLSRALFDRAFLKGGTDRRR